MPPLKRIPHTPVTLDSKSARAEPRSTNSVESEISWPASTQGTVRNVTTLSPAVDVLSRNAPVPEISLAEFAISEISSDTSDSIDFTVADNSTNAEIVVPIRSSSLVDKARITNIPDFSILATPNMNLSTPKGVKRACLAENYIEQCYKSMMKEDESRHFDQGYHGKGKEENEEYVMERSRRRMGDFLNAFDTVIAILEEQEAVEQRRGVADEKGKLVSMVEKNGSVRTTTTGGISGLYF